MVKRQYRICVQYQCIDNVLIVAIAEGKSTALGKTYEIMSRFSTMRARINRSILKYIRGDGDGIISRYTR